MKTASKDKSIPDAGFQLPKVIVTLAIVISVLPMLLHWLGVSFHTHGPADIDALSGTEFSSGELLEVLSGVFVHFLLEWSAVGIAMCTAVLAFIQYRITNNPVTPIIGMALLCAAFMDAFHALAATKIIGSLAENDNFIPFTWALSRMFTATILLLGSGIILFRIGGKQINLEGKYTILIISSVFLLFSYATMQLCALSESLPDTTFADNFIKRPYDFIPMLIFGFLGIVLFPKLHAKQESVFSHSLMWSMLPAVVCQMHMVFGSAGLFDAHFHMAHFLKAFAYTIPFIGMLIDYLNTYVEEQRQLDMIRLAHQRLEAKNKELEQFAYIASHDLQEPLLTISSFSDRLALDYQSKLDAKADNYLGFILDASSRMRDLIKGLLDYSRLGQGPQHTILDTNKLVNRVLDDWRDTIKTEQVSIEVKNLPVVKGNESELRLLFENLISNGIKFQPKGQCAEIQIWAEKRLYDRTWEFYFQDNGIGIAPEHREKVFQIYQRINSRKDFEGTGIGLSHCRKIVELHGGTITFKSILGQGSTFIVSLPMHTEEQH